MSVGIINAGTYTKPYAVKLSQVYCRVQLHAHAGVCSRYNYCMYTNISAAGYAIYYI